MLRGCCIPGSLSLSNQVRRLHVESIRHRGRHERRQDILHLLMRSEVRDLLPVSNSRATRPLGRESRCELLCTLSKYREVHGVAHLPVRRSFGWAHTANAAPDIIGFALATHRCQEAFCLWQAVATHFARVAPIELSISTTGDTRNHHVVWPEYLPRIGHNCGEVSPRRRRLLAALLEIGGAPPLHLDGGLGLEARERTV